MNRNTKHIAIVAVSFGLFLGGPVASQASEAWKTTGNEALDQYFASQTAAIQSQCLAEVQTLDDWKSKRGQYHSELLDMLGLNPMPERTPLDVKVTNTVEHEDFVVELLHFQSRPGLYVTANLYRPKEVKEPLPAVLYVCGHGRVKIDGVSYGNKTHYQHHGSWYARNGYVCLIIDTLQLGEIEGIHHGTYSHNRWWWLGRGYTPAGVEAWNCVRALDLLQQRKDVDPDRLGVTGRSGGGAYSWWIAAIDERIKCAVPVAGITDLKDHVVNGCVEGHCDCMFMVNTFRWDYAKVAALVAPRPLLISNTDSDRIFPLGGVVRIFNEVRRIYKLHDATDQVALNITAGGHKDTQELRVHAFRWMNQHLKSEDALITKTATKMLTPQQLRVLDSIPSDERNTTIDETFTKTRLSDSQTSIDIDTLRKSLLEKSFRAWPITPGSLNLNQTASVDQSGVTLTTYDFESQEFVPLKLYIAHQTGLGPDADLIVVNVLDQDRWNEFQSTYAGQFHQTFDGLPKVELDNQAWDATRKMFKKSKWTMAYVAPRGIGPHAWKATEKKQIQIRRRFNLLGQSVDGMRVYDVRRAIQAIRTIKDYETTQLWLQSEQAMAGITILATIFEPNVHRAELYDLPKSFRNGPHILNIDRAASMADILRTAATHCKVVER